MKNVKSVEHLAKYILKLNADDGLYEQYLKHKLDPVKFFNKNLSEAFSSGYYGIKNNKEHPITAFQCYVCKAVHEKQVFVRSTRLVYDCPKPIPLFSEDDSWSTFWKYGKCELKAFKYFANNTRVSEEMLAKKTMEYLHGNDC